MAVAISGGFEGASYDASGTYVGNTTGTIYIRPEKLWLGNGTSWEHFALKLTGMAGINPTVSLNTANRQWAASSRIWMAAWSYDLHGDQWNAFDTLSVSSSNYNFQNSAAFTQDTVYVCHQPNFSLGRWKTKCETWMGRSYTSSPVGAAEPYILYRTGTRTDVRGATVPSYPVYGFRVTDPSVTSAKIQVILIGGQHVNERHGYWNLEGALDLLMSDDAAARYLREKCDFFVIPHANPQAAHAGYVRSSMEEITKDHNRYWGVDASISNIQRLKDAQLRNAPDCLAFLDYHCVAIYRTESEIWTGNTTVITDYVSKMNTYIPVRLEDSGGPSLHEPTFPSDPLADTTTIRGWATRAFPNLYKGVHGTVEEISNLNKSIADKRLLGRASLFALRDMIVAGKLGAGATAPPPSANAAPTCSMQAPTSGASFVAGSTVTLAASTSDTDGTVAGVKFYTGSGSLIGSATFDSASGWWKRSWSPASGSHTVYAVATDNDAATGKSANRTFSIAEAPVATTTYELTWGYTANAFPATGFRVEESVNNGSWTMFAEVGSAARSHRFGRPDDANKRRWRVLAYNSAGESPPSGIIGDGKA